MPRRGMLPKGWESADRTNFYFSRFLYSSPILPLLRPFRETNGEATGVRFVKNVRHTLGERRYTARKNGIWNCRTIGQGLRVAPSNIVRHYCLIWVPRWRTRGYRGLTLFARVALGGSKPIKKRCGPLKKGVYCLRVSRWNSGTRAVVCARDTSEPDAESCDCEALLRGFIESCLKNRREHCWWDEQSCTATGCTYRIDRKR